MWELLNRVPHGRLSLRNFSLLVTAILVTLLGVVTLYSTPAYAAEKAVRSGTGVIYQENTYMPVGANQMPADVLKEIPDATGYRFLSADNSKAYFVFTSGTASEATSGYYVVYDYTSPNKYGDKPSPPVSVAISPEPTNGADGSTEGPEDVSSCDGSTMGGIGYFVCPTVSFIARGMDKIYGIIANFLEVKTVTGDTNSSIYQLWSVVRDIANVAFVIAFLVIVYSQITSVGISNYNIKSMVPRLMIAAILVNISFWVCAAAVDASNILGYSIHNLFSALMDKFSVGGNYTGTIPTWETIAAVALSGTALAAGGYFIVAATVGGAIYLLIPFLLGAIVSALVALLVLAARQAMITVLIIIAPLAFVAYVLPNTEKHFNKWREGLTTLLILFPIFSVIFSGAQLAGMAIVQSAGGNLLTIILGMAVQVTPLAITPILVKFSNGIIGKVASMANGQGKKLVDKSRDWSKGKAQEHKNKVLADQNRYFKNNPLNRATKAIDSRRRHVEGRRKVYEGMADNRFAATKQGRNLEAMNKSVTNNKQRIDNDFANSERGRQLELQSRHLGVQKQEIDNSLLRSDAGHRFTGRQKLAEIDKSRVGNEFEESTLGHQVDRAKRVVEQEGKRVTNTHQSEWDNAVRTDAGLYQLNLGVKASEAKAAVAKAKLEKVDAEVVAEGSSSEHILQLRGVDAHTQAGMLNIAHDLRTDTLVASAAAISKGQAERVTAEYKTQAFTDNVVTIDGQTIVEYAGGVKGESGRNAVLAKAKSESSAVLMEDIKNIGSTMDYSVSTDNNKLYENFKGTDDLAQKIAYVKAMAGNGGPGITVLRGLLENLGTDGGGVVSPDDLNAFKEILASEPKIMSAGKDIEFYLTNSAHQDADGNVIIKADGKPDYKSFSEISDDLSTWKNLSPSAFASQSPATQFFALKELHDRDPKAYKRIIDGIRTNPGALASVKQRVVDSFSIYSKDVIEEMEKNGEHPVPGEMKTT